MLLGILSDIHEDIVRLSEGLIILKSRAVDELVCLGDLVGYSPRYYDFSKTRDPNAVVSTLSEKCSCAVIGNHDLYALRRVPVNKEFFPYPENWYGLSLKDRQEVSSGQVYLYDDEEMPLSLSPANVRYLESLPEYCVKSFDDHKILLSHYAFPDCTGSSTTEILKSEQLASHFAMMNELDCIYGISGHDHSVGAKVFTASAMSEYSFGAILLPREAAWLNGPAVACQKSTRNAVSIYDSDRRTLEIIPLRSITWCGS